MANANNNKLAVTITPILNDTPLCAFCKLVKIFLRYLSRDRGGVDKINGGIHVTSTAIPFCKLIEILALFSTDAKREDNR